MKDGPRQVPTSDYSIEKQQRRVCDIAFTDNEPCGNRRRKVAYMRKD